jgi:hypothetical protein
VANIVDVFEGALWICASIEILEEILDFDEQHDKLIVFNELSYISYVNFGPENDKNIPILRFLFQKGFDVNKVSNCIQFNFF